MAIGQVQDPAPATTVLKRKNRNLAVHTNPEHSLHLVDPDIPEPGPYECLIHVRATGICGSDVHFWKHGHIGDMVVCGENGLGHESAGEVIAVGSKVSKFMPGDRVALECGVPCSRPTCDFCRTGQYNACPDVVFFSTPPHHGTLRRYHVHPEDWLHHLPDQLSFEEGSLLEPLSVALAGIDRSNLRLGDPLVICGAGPIGLVSLLAAHAAGAAPIVITDIDESRLKRAREYCPRVRTVLVQRKPAKEVADDIVTALGSKAKLVIECTGVESSIHSGIYASQFGSSVFVIGVGKDFQNIPFMHLSSNEIDLRFQYRYHDTYPKAIRLVSEGLLPQLKDLVTHRFKLEEGLEAFKAASSPEARAIKVQILDD